jgi:hypothetical protein
MTKKAIEYRALLEVKNDDGELVFMPTRVILASPKLQAQCVEKAELRRIQRKLANAGIDVEDLARREAEAERRNSKPEREGMITVPVRVIE